MTAKIIVLEGPDGSGKSTLADRLAKLYADDGWDIERIHYGPPAEDDDLIETYFIETMEWFKRNEHKPETQVVRIYDRLHVGEYVYGNILRDESKLTLEDCRWFDSWLERHGAVLIYMAAELDTIVTRLFGPDGRGEDEFLAKYEESRQGQLELLLKIHGSYAKYCMNLDNDLNARPPWVFWTPQHSEVLP